MPYLVVLVVAAGVTAASAPLVARVARRTGALDRPDARRKLHSRPVPTLGGLAMLTGLLAALGSAWLLAALGWDRTGAAPDGVFAPVFEATSEPVGLLLGLVVIVVTGIVDDVRGLTPPVKLAGQVLGAFLAVVQGFQLVHFGVPGVGILVVDSSLGVPATVFVIVAMVNAVNLIDGLDGLAAGVAAIAAAAFSAFAYTTGSLGLTDAVPTSAVLLGIATVGIATGFLAHNFHPARMFMGDTGAMLLGFLLATSGVAFVGRTTDPGYADLAGVFPLFIPAIVLAVPFADAVYAIVRRLVDGRPVAMPDLGHVHHRLVALGLGHRRAVLALYLWSAIAAFTAVGSTWMPPPAVLATVAVASAAAVPLTLARRRPAVTEPPQLQRVSGGER